ncbi:DUF7373 family lipoprotein [Nocardia niigatensis]
MRKLARAIVSVAVAGTAACGSDAAPGPVEPVEPAVDLSKLVTGNLDTKPATYGRAVDLDQAKALEMERLANYLPLPSEIEPEVKYPANPYDSAVRPFVDFGSPAMVQAARKLWSAILDPAYPSRVDAPPKVPDTRCGEAPAVDGYSGSDVKRYHCAIRYRRHVPTVDSDQFTDVYQRAAAQYALMANSTW